MSIRTLSQQKLTTAVYNKTKALLAGSVYFDGTGDYLSLPTSTALVFGSGDFCIESFLYITSGATSGNDGVLWEARGGGTAASGFVFNIRTAGVTGGFKLNFYTDSGANLAATTLAYNTWHHVALTRSGSTVRVFANGALDLTITKSNNFTDNPGITIGQSNLYSDSNITGYMSNLRALKGSSQYTSAFTPPTGPLTAIANTVLLTCQHPDKIIDSSTNAFTVTANGNAAASTTKPF